MHGWRTGAAFWAAQSWACCSAASAAAVWAGGLRVERAPEKGTQAVVTIPLCTDRITEPTVELHTGGDTAQAQQHQYQLRNMLVRELRTMPERGDPDEL